MAIHYELITVRFLREDTISHKFPSTFEDFIHGLDFYSEMAFIYKGVKYGVCYRNDYSVLFYNEMQTWSFPTKDEFYKSASIDGNLLKEMWDEVQDPRYM